MCFKRTYVIVSPCFVKKETMHVLWKKKLRLYSFWRIPIVCFNPIKSSKWVPYDHTSVSWYGSNMVTLHFSMKTRIQRRKIDFSCVWFVDSLRSNWNMQNKSEIGHMNQNISSGSPRKFPNGVKKPVLSPVIRRHKIQISEFSSLLWSVVMRRLSTHTESTKLPFIWSSSIDM